MSLSDLVVVVVSNDLNHQSNHHVGGGGTSISRGGGVGEGTTISRGGGGAGSGSTGRRVRNGSSNSVGTTTMSSCLSTSTHSSYLPPVDPILTTSDKINFLVRKKHRRKLTKRERDELNDLRNSQIPHLLLKSYHLPGFTYWEDLKQYVTNNHPIFGICFHHRLHPVGFTLRLLQLVGSILFGLAIVNIVYICFPLSNAKYDYIHYQYETNFTTGWELLDNNLMDSVTLSNGNIALWTIGASCHALYDHVIWEFATCSCCMSPGISRRKMERYQSRGIYFVIFFVLLATTLSTITLWIRENIEDINHHHTNHDPMNFNTDPNSTYSILWNNRTNNFTDNNNTITDTNDDNNTTTNITNSSSNMTDTTSTTYSTFDQRMNRMMLQENGTTISNYTNNYDDLNSHNLTTTNDEFGNTYGWGGDESDTTTTAAVGGTGTGTPFHWKFLLENWKPSSDWDFSFIYSYFVELCLTYFFYYPLVGFLLFTGIFGCCGRIPVLGGRPYEMKIEQRDNEEYIQQMMELNLTSHSSHSNGNNSSDGRGGHWTSSSNHSKKNINNYNRSDSLSLAGGSTHSCGTSSLPYTKYAYRGSLSSSRSIMNPNGCGLMIGSSSNHKSSTRNLQQKSRHNMNHRPTIGSRTFSSDSMDTTLSFDIEIMSDNNNGAVTIEKNSSSRNHNNNSRYNGKRMSSESEKLPSRRTLMMSSKNGGNGSGSGSGSGDYKTSTHSNGGTKRNNNNNNTNSHPDENNLEDQDENNNSCEDFFEDEPITSITVDTGNDATTLSTTAITATTISTTTTPISEESSSPSSSSSMCSPTSQEQPMQPLQRNMAVLMESVIEDFSCSSFASEDGYSSSSNNNNNINNNNSRSSNNSSSGGCGAKMTNNNDNHEKGNQSDTELEIV